MLTELLFAGTGVEKESRPDRIPGLSGSSLFPCPYRLYKANLGEVWAEGPLVPQQILNMEDGWDQEEQTIKRLWEKARVRVEDRQATVLIGKSGIPGHIDGTVTINGKKRLWEHKAWSSQAFDDFQRWGLKYRPQEYSQVNGYMVGMKLDEANFMVKRKENNDYHDILIKLNLPFITQIIDWSDRIRLEGWIPETKECEYCSHCGLGCFEPALDFSWISTADASEMVEKWSKGKAYKTVGEQMMDEARDYLVGVKDKDGFWLKHGLIGDKDLLRVGSLEVRKIIQHRMEVSKSKILNLFGSDALMQVSSESDIEQYRIREV